MSKSSLLCRVNREDAWWVMLARVHPCTSLAHCSGRSTVIPGLGLVLVAEDIAAWAAQARPCAAQEEAPQEELSTQQRRGLHTVQLVLDFQAYRPHIQGTITKTAKRGHYPGRLRPCAGCGYLMQVPLCLQVALAGKSLRWELDPSVCPDPHTQRVCAHQS
jgi:hypothetical protein